ncbi:uncharacterized protein LOC114579959 [Dendrobium catenatum]|uniref:uncharacterized protein LOC114579959 n=1 Tax=Dendrobium catenatum TaxID=906689 RepID=UPI00109EFA2E|nr:uncharacterized protein LOC114579959 [Dendrobium catenatum]
MKMATLANYFCLGPQKHRGYLAFGFMQDLSNWIWPKKCAKGRKKITFTTSKLASLLTIQLEECRRNVLTSDLTRREHRRKSQISDSLDQSRTTTKKGAKEVTCAKLYLT